MSENITYADLNFTDSAKPRLQSITDVEGHTYAEVKAQSPDTHAAATHTLPDPSCHTGTTNFKGSRRGKSCCSRACVAGLVAVLILLALAVGLITKYYSAASSSPDPTTGTSAPVSATEMAGGSCKRGENDKQDHTDCPRHWQMHGKHCYCFFPEGREMDWNSSRKQCTDMGSDLVVIESREELDYLAKRSRGHYYLLGLTYSEHMGTWKWINNMDHNTSMFPVKRHDLDYFCSVIGHGNVEAASCSGSSTTKNMCKKLASPSERYKQR